MRRSNTASIVAVERDAIAIRGNGTKTMTERELAEMLRGNPDISVDGGVVSYALDKDTFANRIVEAKHPSPKLSEHDLQAAIIAECDRRSILRVEYGLIFTVPNGQYRQGQRREPGMRPGIPDLFLPVAKRGYHGAFLELKVSPNKPSQLQLDWMRNLRAEGYACEVIWDDVDKAMAWIAWYLEGSTDDR